jgi:hypothetical protein
VQARPPRCCCWRVQRRTPCAHPCDSVRSAHSRARRHPASNEPTYGAAEAVRAAAAGALLGATTKAKLLLLRVLARAQPAQAWLGGHSAQLSPSRSTFCLPGSSSCAAAAGVCSSRRAGRRAGARVSAHSVHTRNGHRGGLLPMLTPLTPPERAAAPCCSRAKSC